ncbi:MAG TPA: hypothetical protein VI306_11825, partial [Pyrinomonadaceae bacterium]
TSVEFQLLANTGNGMRGDTTDFMSVEFQLLLKGIEEIEIPRTLCPWSFNFWLKDGRRWRYHGLYVRGVSASG